MNEDHYSINVAVRVAPDTQAVGPYHRHVLKITIPSGKTKKEAVELFEETCKHYPPAEYLVTLSENIYRTSVVRESGGSKKVRA